MDAGDRVAALLPAGEAGLLKRHRGGLSEIRLRAGRPMQLVGDGLDLLAGAPMDASALRRLLAALMEYSVYARQDELDRGFFTLNDGSRVGVCGRVFREGDRLRAAEIGSVCIRVARAVPGCADPLMECFDAPDGLISTLLISPPGMGKTTLLRDIARQLSLSGRRVGIVDERHELAACHEGVPTLDVGPRTDVLDGCPRAEGIRRMLRGMSPQVIVTDEVAGEDDALALTDAARCGVAVCASAHARDMRSAASRACLRAILDCGALRRVALLGPRPGAIGELWLSRSDERGNVEWRRA